MLITEEESLSEEDIAGLKRIAQNDLYFMAKVVLGYKKLVPHVHRGPAKFLTDDEGPLRRGILLPRGHYKTSILTISDTIRLLAKNPEERILLVNEVQENAESFLLEIQRHFENNIRFQRWFPDLIPDFNKTKWSTKEILIPRKGIWREPSVAAIGLGGKAVSRHYTRIKIDDLIGLDTADSPTEMKRAKKWLKYCVSLVSSVKTDRIDLIGTRWSHDDIYQLAMERMGFEFMVRKAIVKGPDGKAMPLFPEEFTMDFFQQIIETDPVQWAANYANDPYDLVSMDFRPEWLSPYTVAPDGNIRYKDQSGSLCYQDTRELTIYIHVDPSMGDNPRNDHCAIVVVGVNPKGEIFILAVWKDHLIPTVLVDKLFELHDYHSPKLVTIESNGFQKSLKYFMQDKMRRDDTYIRVETPRAPSNKSKPARIRGALQPFWSAGMIHHHPSQVDLLAEYGMFGATEEGIHILDALAQGPEYWRAPKSKKVLKRHRDLYEAMTSDRGITGYGI